MKLAAGVLILVMSMATTVYAALHPGLIVPGSHIGEAAIGQDGQILQDALGKPDFQKDNDDGTTLLEWGLLEQSGAIPDATLWVLLDQGKVIKVGTDGGNIYKDGNGLGPGDTLDKFVGVYGVPSSNPAPFFFVFHQGIGVSVRSDGTVRSVWVEATEAPVA